MFVFIVVHKRAWSYNFLSFSFLSLFLCFFFTYMATDNLWNVYSLDDPSKEELVQQYLLDAQAKDDEWPEYDIPASDVALNKEALEALRKTNLEENTKHYTVIRGRIIPSRPEYNQHATDRSIIDIFEDKSRSLTFFLLLSSCLIVWAVYHRLRSKSQ
ncbi:uncharacterized protein B0P05DRAFT_345976 [Gilbertella persicaria]|uniref:uncharacterized protein n=1 Tax=Gilbertella persicaria TaxID=101096 RepID=UPI00221EBA57|nr:uncharacterized protein B0P05DRAFT_345976 [Gilbertella persicaria]KAI8047816.1 hypothetical protein B0P05DRAFT_345976 [Gilbertella persicaria]